MLYLPVIRSADWGPLKSPLLQVLSGILRLSHKLEYSYEQRSRWSRVLTRSWRCNTLHPHPLPLSHWERGVGVRERNLWDGLRTPAGAFEPHFQPSHWAPAIRQKRVAIAGTATRLRKNAKIYFLAPRSFTMVSALRMVLSCFCSLSQNGNMEQRPDLSQSQPSSPRTQRLIPNGPSIDSMTSRTLT